MFGRLRRQALCSALQRRPFFVKTPEECNAKYGANQDVIKASPRAGFSCWAFAQSVSAAARFNAHERPSASFGERVITVGSCRRPTRSPWRLPARYQGHYSEKIVYVLNSYQPKDNKRQSRASKPPRPAYSIDDAKDIMDVFENTV